MNLARYGKLANPQNISALPAGVPLSQVYADFLRYLLQHTQQFFEDSIFEGKAIWQNHKPNMDLIIAHPNGWGIREQTFLRTAAVAAGFTSTDKALKQVHFVTEAEASVHFCMYYTTLGSQLKVITAFMLGSRSANFLLVRMASILLCAMQVDRLLTQQFIL
jgi:hypothetical protein